ncbi:MAG: sigma-70 family RNA polymerase sigma factor [Bacteroidaceae bacterium]|nr:sigma-70 family RNA polymerase sigma factor [Bacteroidaceae bacterium]
MNFEEFYKTNYITLYRLALSILHDKEESRDIVAETFKRLWQMWETTDNPDALARQILRNACISRLRHLEVHERFKKRIISDTDINSLSDIRYEKRIELLRLYISTLDKEEQALIHLVIFEKRTLKEAAEILGCSYATARRHFASLMLKLKSYITNCEN